MNCGGGQITPGMFGAFGYPRWVPLFAVVFRVPLCGYPRWGAPIEVYLSGRIRMCSTIRRVMGAYESMWGVKGDNGGKKRQENLPAPSPSALRIRGFCIPRRRS